MFSSTACLGPLSANSAAAGRRTAHPTSSRAGRRATCPHHFDSPPPLQTAKPPVDQLLSGFPLRSASEYVVKISDVCNREYRTNQNFTVAGFWVDDCVVIGSGKYGSQMGPGSVLRSDDCDFPGGVRPDPRPFQPPRRVHRRDAPRAWFPPRPPPCRPDIVFSTSSLAQADTTLAVLIGKRPNGSSNTSRGLLSDVSSQGEDPGDYRLHGRWLGKPS